MPAPRLKLLLVSGSVAVVALAGCGSSKPAASSASATTGGAGPSATAGSSATLPDASSVPSGSTPATTLFTPGPVPDVAGAQDLSKEPVIAPGTGAPPAALTGKDLVEGKGAVAGAAAGVTVQYVGALWSGKVFDASWTDSGPATFQLNGVIPGFKDAIIGMAVGGRREIVIPPQLGYGAAGQPPTIPPNSTLVFVIDLLQVQQ